MIYVRMEEAANPNNFATTSFQLHVVAQPTVYDFWFGFQYVQVRQRI